jgi:hypothetical protein
MTTFRRPPSPRYTVPHRKGLVSTSDGAGEMIEVGAGGGFKVGGRVNAEAPVGDKLQAARAINDGLVAGWGGSTTLSACHLMRSPGQANGAPQRRVGASAHRGYFFRTGVSTLCLVLTGTVTLSAGYRFSISGCRFSGKGSPRNCFSSIALATDFASAWLFI